MRREATQQSHEFELGVMSGYGMARDEKYRRRRLAEMRRALRGLVPSTNTGKPNIAGWQQLARMLEEGGMPVQRGGERLVN